MRILLTGGSGFLGRNLREALEGRHDVFAPSHSELDVTDAAAVRCLFRERRFDAVLHAAVEGGERVLETTLRGYWNLALHSEEVGRFLYFGSGAEFGKQRDLVKVREEEVGRVLPADPYGLAKFLCNEDARRRSRVTNLRLFGVYGPHEGYLFRFISNAIVKTLLGLEVVVRQDVVFDYLYVGDLMKVVDALLEKDPGVRDINVTPTDSISLRRILEILASVSPSPFSARFECEGLNFQYTGDNGRLLAALPGFRFASYEDGIRRLYDHYASRRETLDRAAVVRDDYRNRCRPRASESPNELIGDP